MVGEADLLVENASEQTPEGITPDAVANSSFRTGSQASEAASVKSGSLIVQPKQSDCVIDGLGYVDVPVMNTTQEEILRQSDKEV